MLQEEAEEKAAAAQREVRQWQLKLRQAEAEMQQRGADMQLQDHAATLRLSELQHSYTRLLPWSCGIPANKTPSSSSVEESAFGAPSKAHPHLGSP